MVKGLSLLWLPKESSACPGHRRISRSLVLSAGLRMIAWSLELIQIWNKGEPFPFGVIDAEKRVSFVECPATTRRGGHHALNSNSRYSFTVSPTQRSIFILCMPNRAIF